MQTADLRYLSRFDVNRGLPAPFTRRGGLGDLEPGQRHTPKPVPYRELSSAPLRLAQEQDRIVKGLAGLGDPGFFSTSKKWRRRWAMVEPDIMWLDFTGYEYRPKDINFIRNVQLEVAKERAERSGISRLAQDVAIPAVLTIASAGALTPLSVGMAVGSGVVNAVMVDKYTNKAIENAEKQVAIENDITTTKGEIDKIQKEIAEYQRQSGKSKAEINKAIQIEANKQEGQKKGLAAVLTVGGLLALTTMAA